MKILPFDRDNKDFITEGASLLREAFPHSYNDCAEEEMELILDDERAAFMAVEEGHLIGLVGAIPQYGLTGWELHPLVVKEGYRKGGVGRALMEEIEKELSERGCLVIYLGSDDEFGTTSLSNTDLFEDTFQKIDTIKNLKGHPFEFYQKVGYKIVGVIPDANGIGKPDIWMAKRVGAMPQEV